MVVFLRDLRVKSLQFAVTDELFMPEHEIAGFGKKKSVSRLLKKEPVSGTWMYHHFPRLIYSFKSRGKCEVFKTLF
jgi:hypothetical protein